MERERLSTEEIVKKYRNDAKRLARYLSWLEGKSGRDVASSYAGEGIAEHSIAVPTYDGTLMSFVKEARQTVFMDKNFQYVYSRKGIRTPEQERRAIAAATIQDMDILCGILSSYVLQGMVKSRVWVQGVDERIFLLSIKKVVELIDHWDTSQQP